MVPPRCREDQRICSRPTNSRGAPPADASPPGPPERQRHAHRWIGRYSVVRDRGVETLAKREDGFAHGGGRESFAEHLGYSASNGRVGDPDKWGGAKLGQDLDLQRYLEPCARCQPEVVAGLDPIGGPLLQSHFTATRIAPQSAADFELDLRFSASASTRRRFVSLCGLPAASR